MQTIDREVPAHLAVHLVLDNSSTHKTPKIKRWLAQHPRFVLHFTPTSSSWINLVERWFGELTTKLLRRGAHPTEITGHIQLTRVADEHLLLSAASAARWQATAAFGSTQRPFQDLSACAIAVSAAMSRMSVGRPLARFIEMRSSSPAMASMIPSSSTTRARARRSPYGGVPGTSRMM